MLRRFGSGLVRAVPALAVLLISGHLAGAAAPQAPSRTAKEIIARHVEAIGGEAAFKAVKSMRARGTFAMTAQQISGEFEMLAARPNKILLRVDVAALGRIETGFDGKIGWSVDPMMGPALLKDRQLSEMTDEAWFDGPLHGPDQVREVTLVGREPFDSRLADKLKVVFLSGSEQFEFFDTESGLQIGFEASRATQMGIVPTTAIFRDFKKYGALQLPTLLVQRGLGIEQVMRVSGYEFDVVSPDAFDLPPAIKALIK